MAANVPRILDGHRDRIQTIDAELFRLSAGINLLTRLAWPASTELEFLERWRAGAPRAPQVHYPRIDETERRRGLERLARTLDPDDPLEAFLIATALSYADSCELLEAAGTRHVDTVSRRIYGTPQDVLTGTNIRIVEAAGHFMAIVRAHYKSQLAEPQNYCLSAETLRTQLEEAASSVLAEHPPKIVVDPCLVSKASAGAKRVRIRAGTYFTEYDLEQLLQHEVFVHSLTAINGRTQPLVRSLGRGAPRTTKAQEGLATFAELITGAIDVARLERIAMRVEATDRALSGADFVEVFRYFIEEGRPELESFNSTKRIFRGVPTTGGFAFTKDAVYLHGLLQVQTFFRWALRAGRLDVARHLFAGRLTLGDAVRLGPYFDSGVLAEPESLPPWMTRTNGLAAYLAFSVFTDHVSLDDVAGETWFFDTTENMSR